jgi:hypothetical protein
MLAQQTFTRAPLGTFSNTSVAFHSSGMDDKDAVVSCGTFGSVVESRRDSKICCKVSISLLRQLSHRCIATMLEYRDNDCGLMERPDFNLAHVLFPEPSSEDAFEGLLRVMYRDSPKQILLGLDYLHKKRIRHGDLTVNLSDCFSCICGRCSRMSPGLYRLKTFSFFSTIMNAKSR